MKKTKILLTVLLSSGALFACSPAQASSEPSVSYKVSWISPTGTPTLAFYDQGSNSNWISSSSPATDVVPAFATDNFDAIVFDGYAGLKNIQANNRNYKLARWISAGNFYLVSTKHTSEDPYLSSYSIDSFVLSGNGSQSMLSLARNNWGWGDVTNSCTFENGVTDVLSNLVGADNYDYYLLAEPALTNAKAKLEAKGTTLHIVHDLQREWINSHNGNKIPAAAIFVNKTKYEEHTAKIRSFLAETDERIDCAIENPELPYNALRAYEGKNPDSTDCIARFGYTAETVLSLQANNENRFALIEPDSISSLKEVATSFASGIDENISFSDSLFLE